MTEEGKFQGIQHPPSLLMPFNGTLHRTELPSLAPPVGLFASPGCHFSPTSMVSGCPSVMSHPYSLWLFTSMALNPKPSTSMEVKPTSCGTCLGKITPVAYENLSLISKKSK